MARKGGAATALCAAMAWSFSATPVAAMSAALHFGTPTKLSRMSFDVTAYPAAFFEASYISRQLERDKRNENKKFMASHRAPCAPRSVAAIECTLVTDLREYPAGARATNDHMHGRRSPSTRTDEQKTIRLRGGARRSKPGFDASYIGRQLERENKDLAKFMAPHHAPEATQGQIWRQPNLEATQGQIECILDADEHKTIRLRGGERRSTPAWNIGS